MTFRSRSTGAATAVLADRMAAEAQRLRAEVAWLTAERDRYRRRLMSESARMADALDLLDDYDYSTPWTDEDLVTSGWDVIEAARQVIEAARDLGLVPAE